MVRDILCIDSLHYSYTKLNLALAIVGRFSGLHDMLKIVMAGELEIIVNEER